MRSVLIVIGLVGIATVVAAFARRTSVPAPSLLVVAGLVVGLVPGTPHVQVDPEVISLIVLPPLLYAAGEELPWRDLKAVWRPVAVLAVGLVLVSAAAVGAVTVAVVGLPVAAAFLLGTVLASTDPVAVTALGRRLALPSRLQTLVQAESLFNDATSLILFRIAVGFVLAGGTLSAGAVTWDFIRLAGGGALIGAAVAAVVALIRRRTEDPLVETVVTLLTPYLAFVAAEVADASGVTAVVVASVILGVLAPRLSGSRTRLQAEAVHGTVVFVLESVVFALIGLELPGLIEALSSSDRRWLLPSLAIAATLVLVRLAWVFPLALIRRRDDGARSVWQVSAVVSWAGARGVIPLTAALSIPLFDDAGRPLADRDLLQVLATAVIVISLVVQGFTLAPLVRRAGLAVPRADTEEEYARARLEVAEAGLAYVDDLEARGAVPPLVLERVRRSLRTRVELARDGAGDAGQLDIGRTYRDVRREVVSAQTRLLARMYADGTVGEATRRRLQRQLDMEDARFDDDR